MITLAEINLTDPGILTALVTLTVLEIILGVDNIIFISIVSNKLPEEQQPRARLIGLLLAMIFRIGLLLTITWIIKLTNPIFTIPFIEDEGQPLGISWKDLILIAGGIFLVFKSTLEIHHKLEKVKPVEQQVKVVPAAFGNKAYIYTAIAFSLIVELINMRLRKNNDQIEINNKSL
ncbi:MAG: hypothetical protein EOO14_26960 [Chitinophagaceae bacterium]|nr:MAG: hypothetical protein EOO14_26960 [Chitinophagaceae bacterium]